MLTENTREIARGALLGTKRRGKGLVCHLFNSGLLSSTAVLRVLVRDFWVLPFPYLFYAPASGSRRVAHWPKPSGFLEKTLCRREASPPSGSEQWGAPISSDLGRSIEAIECLFPSYPQLAPQSFFPGALCFCLHISIHAAPLARVFLPFS